MILIDSYICNYIAFMINKTNGARTWILVLINTYEQSYVNLGYQFGFTN